MADKGVLLRRRPRIVVINNLFESGQNRGNTRSWVQSSGGVEVDGKRFRGKFGKVHSG